MSLDGGYLDGDETAKLMLWWPSDQLTHGICSDCFDVLERRRRAS